MSYYVYVCPDTQKVFICEHGVDNNLCQVFPRTEDQSLLSLIDEANRIADAMNRAHELDSQPTVTLAFHQNEVRGLRQGWTEDIQKLTATIHDMTKQRDSAVAEMTDWRAGFDRVTAAKNKAMGALKTWVGCEYPNNGKPCGYCIVCKLFTELEEAT